jgi:nucleoside triphosphate diphosphatase
MKSNLNSRLANSMHNIADVLARLRAKTGGCPWDVEQTFASIAPYTIEEAYEVADAISRNDMADLKEELGDLLFQVVFHARMAEEQGAFDLADVAAAIAQKMTRRHPHVFDSADNRTAADQTRAWEVQKAAEREAKGTNENTGALSGVARALPALKRAQKFQSRAARVGFDWPTLDGVVAKMQEELDEVRDAMAAGKQDWIAEEVGDLLFSVVNLARKLDVDAETALGQANSKFERRFMAMEKLAETAGHQMAALPLDDLENLWQQAKVEEKQHTGAA